MGPERTLFYAAALVMVGHLGLSILPGLVGVGVGLVCIALGSGAVKANSTAMVGTLYSENDPRRDAGFSIYYLGINLGALIGPLVTGWLQVTWGFRLGFAAAAVGMAIGLTQYAFARRRFPAEDRRVPNPIPRDRRIRYLLGLVIVAAVITVLVVTGVITADRLVTIVVGISLLAAITYFTVILRSRRVTPVERNRVIAFIPMFIASTAFWSLYQQQGTVLTIYADTEVNRDLFGYQLPVPWVLSSTPIFVIVLSGLFAALWTRLGDRQPSTPIKFALGTAVMGVGFLLMMPLATTIPDSAPLLGITAVMFVFTIAELLLSPVGLSLSTKLAPAAFQTQMVALFFLSVALGTALSGQLARFYSEADQVPYFGILGGIAIVIGVVLALLAPWLKRLMGGVR
jgi:POT family proton-dependent oligopeptide transporter